MDFVVSPSSLESGALTVPGDKSVSHRALMLAAIANGDSEITGLLVGEDCLATLQALRDMGVEADRSSETTVHVRGAGMTGLRPPGGDLDLGNSGTAMRMFAGLLSAQRLRYMPGR